MCSARKHHSYAHMHVHTSAISSSRRGLSKRNIGEPPTQGTCMTFNFPVANQRKFSSSSKKVILLLKGILVYLKCYHFNSTESRKIINILLPLYTKPLKSAVYLTWTAHPKSDQPHCKCWITTWSQWLLTTSDITPLNILASFYLTTHHYLFHTYLTMISILKCLLQRYLSQLAEIISTQKKKPRRKANRVFLHTQLSLSSPITGLRTRAFMKHWSQNTVTLIFTIYSNLCLFVVHLSL